MEGPWQNWVAKPRVTWSSNLTSKLGGRWIPSPANKQWGGIYEAWSVSPPALSLSRSRSASLVGLHLSPHDSAYTLTLSPGFVPMSFATLLGFVGLGPPTSQHPRLAFGPRLNTFLPYIRLPRFASLFPIAPRALANELVLPPSPWVQTSSHFHLK